MKKYIVPTWYYKTYFSDSFYLCKIKLICFPQAEYNLVNDGLQSAEE